eukprot:6880867-Alexandrium_andersonii.AAC.1
MAKRRPAPTTASRGKGAFSGTGWDGCGSAKNGPAESTAIPETDTTAEEALSGQGSAAASAAVAAC